MKKDDNGFEDTVRMLSSLLGDEDKGDAGKALGGMFDVALDFINAQYYRYKRPNYKKVYGNALPTWLKPIWNVKDEDDIRELFDKIAEKGKNIADEQKHEDFKKYLWRLFDVYRKEDDNSVWRLFGIFWLMEHFGIKDIDLVLEALRQDAHFVSHYTLGMDDIMIAALYENADDNVDKLKEFMYSQGVVPTGKQFVFSAIAYRIMHHPEERLSIVSWLTQFLNHCYEICMQGASAANLGKYIQVLAQVNVTEAMPTIEKIIKDSDFTDFEYTTNLHQIWHDMKTPFETIPKEMFTMDYYVDQWGNNDDDDESFLNWLESGEWDDDDDPELDEHYSELYDVDEPQKQYSISIDWNENEDFLNPISVQLVVPSNIYLDRFAKLIMLAFGRKDLPSWYFVDMPGDTYTTQQSRVAKLLKKNGMETEDAEDYTLGEILNKHDNMIRFYLCFPDSYKESDWAHNITLLNSGDYGRSSSKLVRLEDIHGVYPPKKVKHAAEYLAHYKSSDQKTPNVKAIRKAIDRWVEDLE